jgi:hypothetical protein
MYKESTINFGTNSQNTFGTNSQNTNSQNTFGTNPQNTFVTNSQNTFGTNSQNKFWPNSQQNNLPNASQSNTFGESQPNTFGVKNNSFQQPINLMPIQQNSFQQPINPTPIQKIECQISLNMSKDNVKDSLLDEILIKPKLSKIEECEINLSSKFTKDTTIKSCTVMISNDSNELIKNSMIGGVSIIKDYTKIEIIKKVQNHIKFINLDFVTVNYNELLINLYEKYDKLKPDYIYVINENKECIGVVRKNDLEILSIINFESLIVYQIMTDLNFWFNEKDYDWYDLMENKNKEMLNNFRNVNTIPILNDSKQIIGEISLNNLSNFYKLKGTMLLNKNGRIFTGVQVDINFDIKVINELNVDLIYIESDNVYNDKIIDIINKIKNEKDVKIMIGKVLNGEMYKYFSECNKVDCISVGNGTELGHLNMLQECKIEYLNYKVPIISNSGKIKDSNIYKVLIGGANCILIENLNENTLETIKRGLASINIKSIECLNDEKIEIYKYK